MCTIDPTMCWYYDHLEYWRNNPEELKKETLWQKVLSETSILKSKYIQDQIASGRIKAHRIKEAVAGRGDSRYECYTRGYMMSSGPVKEDRICFDCKKSIDT